MGPNINYKMIVLKATIAVWGMVALGSVSGAQKSTLFVSVEPQAYVIERLAGDLVNVESLLPAGATPHAYEPKPSQLARLAGAKSYFKIGLPFEKPFLASIESASPAIRVIDMRIGVDLIPLEREHHHEGEIYDPHVWLSPANLRRMADVAYRELIALHPEKKLRLRRSLGTFLEELQTLTQNLENWFGRYKGRSFYVYHPAYGYFARETGLKQVAIEFEGKEPTGRRLSKLIEKAKQDEVKKIFVQPQFAPVSAETIAEEIGAEVDRLDPLAKDAVQNIKDISRKILASFRSEPKE